VGAREIIVLHINDQQGSVHRVLLIGGMETGGRLRSRVTPPI
jgi:hypothetical protein